MKTAILIAAVVSIPILLFGSSSSTGGSPLLLVKPYPWSPDSSAEPMPYIDYDDHTGYLTVQLPDHTTTQIDTGRIVSHIPYTNPNDFPELTDDTDFIGVKNAILSLNAAERKYPNARAVIEENAAPLRKELDSYLSGNRKHDGKWYSGKQFAALLKENPEEQRALIAKEQAEQKPQAAAYPDESDAQSVVDELNANTDAALQPSKAVQNVQFTRDVASAQRAIGAQSVGHWDNPLNHSAYNQTYTGGDYSGGGFTGGDSTTTNLQQDQPSYDVSTLKRVEIEHLDQESGALRAQVKDMESNSALTNTSLPSTFYSDESAIQANQNMINQLRTSQ